MTQAGSGYAAATAATIISSPLVQPGGVAVDASGNVYIADTGDDAVKEWSAATKTLSTLVASGLSGPQGVAVDTSGNVYIADTGDNAVKEWNAAAKTLSTLVASGLSGPQGVAVDASGNVYIADTGDNAVKEWNAATKTLSTLVASGLSGPQGAAVDASGNVYIADTGDNAVKEWNAAAKTLSTLVSSGVNGPQGVAVDPSGNVYFVDSYQVVSGTDFYNAIVEWNVATQKVSVLAYSNLNSPAGVAVDGLGNVYIADTGDNAVKEWNAATQAVSTLVAAAVGDPYGAAVDSSGNLYIADSGDNPIEKWNAASQTLTTLVSSGLKTPVGVAAASSGNVYIADSGDNAIEEWNAASQTLLPLVGAGLDDPAGIAIDSSGNLYIADAGDNAIEEWNAASQTLTTLISSGLNYPEDVAVDASGNLYVADYGDNSVKEWNAATKTLTTLVSAGLHGPEGVAVDASGNVYIADTDNKAVKEWKAATQTVATLISSGLKDPAGVAVDASGNVDVVDWGNSTLMELPRTFVSATAITESALAGGDVLAVLPATAPLTGHFAPSSDENWLTFGSASGGAVHFSYTQNAGAVRTAHIALLGQEIAVTQAGATSPAITTVAGDGTRGYGGDGGPATAATLFDPADVAVDSKGDIFIADYVNNRVREISAATGDISTVAGNGLRGFSGDGGPATAAALDEPAGLAVDSAGDIFIADYGDNRVREVHYTPNYAASTITTVAGDGTAGYSGDNGPATAAELFRPSGVAVDPAGTILYIADELNNRIRKVNLATGVITTVVGDGAAGFSGDGGLATAAALDHPWAVAIDAAGDLFFADAGNNRIREVTAGGTISTVAGDGTAGFSGDGGPATAAEIDAPRGMAIDAAGDIFFADLGNNRVREVNAATGLIATVAGTGSGGYGGDGGAAITAALHFPEAVALDASGNLYVADTLNNRIREIIGIATASAMVRVSPASPATANGPAMINDTAAPAIFISTAGFTSTAGAAWKWRILPWRCRCRQGDLRLRRCWSVARRRKTLATS